jgi:hypothetical protein
MQNLILFLTILFSCIAFFSLAAPMDSLADRKEGAAHHSHWPHLTGMDADAAIELLKVCE